MNVVRSFRHLVTRDKGASGAVKTVIHIGHGKTGSSAIQSFLALNAERLAEFGVDYPATDNTAEAALGQPTNGNFDAFTDYEPTDRCTLFSSETFYPLIEEGSPFLDRLNNLEGGVRLICFTRNIFEHFFSAWGQHIKAEGGVHPIDVYAKLHNLYPNLLKRLRQVEDAGVTLELRNYSCYKRDLEAVFLRMVLGRLADDFLREARHLPHRVNRSLTLAEYELQRQFNMRIGAFAAHMIASPLVREHPALATEAPRISPATAELILEKNTEASKEINRRLPDDEAVSLDIAPDLIREAPESGAFSFREEQLATIAEHVAAHVASPDNATLFDADAETLRDIALTYESGQPLSRAQALELMYLARRVRPEGAIINGRISDWEDRDDA